MKFDETGKRLVMAVDVDGTLTNGEKFWECEPTPNQAMIDKVIEWYASGRIIIIWSARQWNLAQDTVAWLRKHNVPFHGLALAKGGADFYVDDKALRPEEALNAPEV